MSAPAMTIAGANFMDKSVRFATAGLGVGVVISDQIKAEDKTPDGWKLTQHAVDQLKGRFSGNLTLDRLDELIKLRNGIRVIDSRSGNINVYVNSEFSRTNLMRITVPVDGQRIISIGFERLNRVNKFINEDIFMPIK